MNLKELIALYRAQAFDKVEDYFCSDEELTIYANEAQEEACRRGQLLVSSSAPLCTVAFQAGAESVKVSDRIILIKRAFVDAAPVISVDVERMDAMHPGWQFQEQQGSPSALVTGLASCELYFWPRPREAGTLRMTVQHLPLKPMRLATCERDCPEIRPELHKGLVDWMLYRAYSREDTDLYNDTKALLALKRFEDEFGRKASGRNEEWTRQGGGMMPGPIS
ncbi:DUF6682 family protein [Comamonas jiangduensis]|uniref:phage adaptor protein n=1 Tax=Comamonas jiangduensis TaxID=1194168 RepID=UPI003BF8ACCF